MIEKSVKPVFPEMANGLLFSVLNSLGKEALSPILYI